MDTSAENDASAGSLETIHVVAAVIEQDDRILVTRRLRGTHLEGCWEFPGGKIDASETHEAALRREIREELDADVEVGRLVLATAHTYPERRVHLYFYQCVLVGTVRAVLGQDMRWVTRADLRTLQFPAADAELIEVLAAGSTGPGLHSAGRGLR